MDKAKRAIALGFFDGVHTGHGALLRRVGEVAARNNLVPSAFTFDTHPENLIMGTPMPLITTPADRADLMRRLYGIRDVIVARFDQRMMRMDWRSFVSDYLVEENGAAWLVAGHDFHFGYKGEGNPQRLQEFCKGLGVGCDIIPRIEKDGITVSSTYIRTLLAQGEMERAMEFLGHPHVFTAQVSHGKRLGTSLGFPTVNLQIPSGILVPAFGVYAARAWLEDGSCHLCVTNIGTRPTVDCSGSVNVEGFLLDFSGDLYGQTVRMEFFRRLRGEERFSSLEALRSAILKDTEATKQYFNELSASHFN